MNPPNQSGRSLQIHVTKIGGSVLRLNDCRDRIAQWRDTVDERTEDDSIFLWIAGGGAMVDIVRKWDEQFELGSESAHRLACRAMSMTCRLVAQLFPDWNLVDFPELISKIANREYKKNLLLDCTNWLLATSHIPQNWTVTSDSIAAFLLVELSHQFPDASFDLHILKALRNEPSGVATAQDVLDEHFPNIQTQLTSIAKNISIVDIGDGQVKVE